MRSSILLPNQVGKLCALRSCITSIPKMARFQHPPVFCWPCDQYRLQVERLKPLRLKRHRADSQRDVKPDPNHYAAGRITADRLFAEWCVLEDQPSKVTIKQLWCRFLLDSQIWQPVWLSLSGCLRTRLDVTNKPCWHWYVSTKYTCYSQLVNRCIKMCSAWNTNMKLNYPLSLASRHWALVR